MAKRITADVLKYFPQLPKSASWEQFVDQLKEVHGIELGIDAPIVNRTRIVKVTLYKGDNKWARVSFSDEYWDDVHMDFEYDKIYEGVFKALKDAKAIRKPRGGKAIQKANEDELKELKRLRDNLTMRICAWKKVGKDVTELLAQKESLTKQIKAMK